ncbi:hypothetical protein NECAME_18890, partial [Necator americanus]
MDAEKQRVAVYRCLIYAAIGYSVIPLLSICVNIPMVYNYIHYVKNMTDNDIKYCK